MNLYPKKICSKCKHVDAQESLSSFDSRSVICGMLQKRWVLFSIGTFNDLYEFRQVNINKDKTEEKLKNYCPYFLEHLLLYGKEMQSRKNNLLKDVDLHVFEGE